MVRASHRELCRVLEQVVEGANCPSVKVLKPDAMSLLQQTANRRQRPTDATWWFWSLVSVFFGFFFLGIFPVAGVLWLVVAPGLFVWQFVSWKRDADINWRATDWCRRHYPASDDSPIVDFMVAVAYDTRQPLSSYLPVTPLDHLNPFVDDDEWNGNLTGHQRWLAHLLDEARIKHLDPAGFAGTTLDVVVQFLIRSGQGIPETLPSVSRS